MENALEIVNNNSDISNALAEITPDSLPSSTKEVKELAKATANGICQKFEGLYEILAYSKELNSQARNAKTDMRKYFTLGIFGKSATQKKQTYSQRLKLCKINLTTKCLILCRRLWHLVF